MQYRHCEVQNSSRPPSAERSFGAAAWRRRASQPSRANKYARRNRRAAAFAFFGCFHGRASGNSFFAKCVPAGKFCGRGSSMKCQTVRTRLPGYLDDVVTGAARVEERTVIREHLEGCNVCRAELEKFRKLSVLLSRVPKNDPPADLSVRIKVAAAQAQHSQDWQIGRAHV